MEGGGLVGSCVDCEATDARDTEVDTDQRDDAMDASWTLMTCLSFMGGGRITEEYRSPRVTLSGGDIGAGTDVGGNLGALVGEGADIGSLLGSIVVVFA